MEEPEVEAFLQLHGELLANCIEISPLMNDISNPFGSREEIRDSFCRSFAVFFHDILPSNEILEDIYTWSIGRHSGNDVRFFEYLNFLCYDIEEILYHAVSRQWCEFNAIEFTDPLTETIRKRLVARYATPAEIIANESMAPIRIESGIDYNIPFESLNQYTIPSRMYIKHTRKRAFHGQVYAKLAIVHNDMELFEMTLFRHIGSIRWDLFELLCIYHRDDMIRRCIELDCTIPSGAGFLYYTDLTDQTATAATNEAANEAEAADVAVSSDYNRHCQNRFLERFQTESNYHSAFWTHTISLGIVNAMVRTRVWFACSYTIAKWLTTCTTIAAVPMKTKMRILEVFGRQLPSSDIAKAIRANQCPDMLRLAVDLLNHMEKMDLYMHIIEEIEEKKELFDVMKVKRPHLHPWAIYKAVESSHFMEILHYAQDIDIDRFISVVLLAGTEDQLDAVIENRGGNMTDALMLGIYRVLHQENLRNLRPQTFTMLEKLSSIVAPLLQIDIYCEFGTLDIDTYRYMESAGVAGLRH